MATTILKDAYVSIDAVVYGSVVNNVAVGMSAEALDVTAMGDGTRERLGGVLEWNVQLEMWGDEAVTGALFAKLGATVALELRPSSAAVSVSNPKYTGNGVVTELTPIKGGVGEPNGISMTILSGGPLTRATS